MEKEKRIDFAFSPFLTDLADVAVEVPFPPF